MNLDEEEEEYRREMGLPRGGGGLVDDAYGGYDFEEDFLELAKSRAGSRSAADDASPKQRGAVEGRRVPAGSTLWASQFERRKADTKERVLRERVDREAEDCTFRPRINKASATRKQLHGPAYERLATSIDAVYRKREREKMEKDAAQLKEDCTFKPVISETKAQRTVHGNVCDRLHKDAWRQELKRREREVEKTVNETVGLFRPRIRRSSSCSAQTAEAPFHERLGEIRRKSEQRRVDLALQYRDTNSCTFTPSICPRSRSVEIVGRSPYNARTSSTERRSSPCCQPVSPDYLTLRHLREKPAINKRSKQLAAQREQYHGCHGFVERQEYETKRRENRLAHAQRQREAAVAPKPVVKSSGEIGRSLEVMFYRTKQRDDRVRNLQQDALKGLFQPKVLRTNVRPGTGLRSSREADVEKIRRQRDASLQKEATFHPSINTHSQTLVEVRRNTVRSGSPAEARRAAVIREVQQRVLEDQKHCTHRPAINHYDPSSLESTAVVKGLEKHVDKQRAAQEMESQRREREAAEFKVNPAALKARPFNISTGSKQRKRVQEEDHPFKPRTNESGREKLLKRIVEEFDSDAGNHDGLHLASGSSEDYFYDEADETGSLNIQAPLPHQVTFSP